MDVQRAKFVRWVEPNESREQLVHDAKALSWEHECEHAVLELNNNRLVLVGGGRVGIEFLAEGGLPVAPDGHATVKLFVEVEGEVFRIKRIVFHTHPMATGPSDWDLRVLEMLNQTESCIYEINGPTGGTLIRPKERR